MDIPSVTIYVRSSSCLEIRYENNTTSLSLKIKYVIGYKTKGFLIITSELGRCLMCCANKALNKYLFDLYAPISLFGLKMKYIIIHYGD